MSATFYVTLEKVFQQAIWFLLFLILAPVLGPTPYGQFAIAMVFIGFCELVMLEAATESLLGMQSLEHRHLGTLNLVGLSVAALIGVVLFLTAPLLGRAFGDEQLGMIFKTLSILPAISILTAGPVAVLKHELRFAPLALRSILGLTIGGVCGVVVAFHGGGVWALVAQVLAQRLAENAILWSSARMRFAMTWSRPHFLDLWGFAANVFMSRGVGYASAHVPRLILGAFLGTYELGLIVFAWRLPEVFIWTTIVPPTSVARVTLRQYAPGERRLFDAFSRLIEDTAIVAFPICCGAAAVTPLVFAIALDARWQPAALPAQIMILSVLPALLFYSGTSILLALRFPRDEVLISVSQVVSTTLCVLCAAPFGLVVVSLAILLRNVLLTPYLLRVLFMRCAVTPRLIWDAVGASLAASLLMGGVVAWAGMAFAHRFGPLVALPIAIAFGILIYGGLIAVFARDAATRLTIRWLPKWSQHPRRAARPIAPAPEPERCPPESTR